MNKIKMMWWAIKRRIKRKERIVKISDMDMGKTLFRINGRCYTLMGMEISIQSYTGNNATLEFREILMPPEHQHCKCAVSWVTQGGDEK